MPEHVRVSVNGQHVTTTRAYAESAGLTVLKEAADDGLGRALPATRTNGRRNKPRTTVEREAAKKTTTTTARKRAAKKSTSGGSTASTSEETS